jgi:hypothetical protein
MGLYLCLLSFTLCYLVGRRSLVNGLIAVLGVGYLYGITRANVPETVSHFIFDSGVLGFYAALWFRPMTLAQKSRLQPLQIWTEILMLWPVVVFFLPFQDLMIRVVGLRASIFFLPFLLIGAKLMPEERYKLALGIAALNLMALAFAGAEFFLGVESFFPRNQMTRIIYVSKDVSGNTAYRIPSSFANAHAYGGAMFSGIPLLAGALLQQHRKQRHGQLLILGLAAALLGVLLSATRLNFVAAAILIIILTFSIKSRIGYAFGWIVIMVVIGMFVAGETRLQRYTQLQNAEMVKERIVGSVNMNFLELATQYPFGNGLGGGGTSIPQFLQDRIANPVGMENEYARIMLEQGIFGLCLWIGFIIWVLTRRQGNRFDSWRHGGRLAWYACAISFGVGLLGTGLFTSIPQTCLLLINVGWVATRQQAFLPDEENRAPSHALKHAEPIRVVQSAS